MMVFKRHFAGLLACLSLSGTSGCSSFMSHSGPDQGYYSGTRASAKIVADSNSGWVMRPLAAIDLPFSAVMDTLLLPWDYYRAGSDKALDSPRERILRSEQENHTNESLSQAAPLVIHTSNGTASSPVIHSPQQ
ncbi:YceK/YidQ family lipoprotein [Pantoea sp. CCBC3-3-1]|uniref:YceK/YidQ family lipoprotein n=1 Tax=Pantoea sp. CCBC3-3-1 TaxID=2490851 RepID=UPI0011BEDDD0|nr:YceK/YidQ family lipoprotein [Pantoea sp. CCBC3-3-1]